MKKEEAIKLLKQARITLQWLEDQITGEMIETKDYRRTHLFPGSVTGEGISQKNLTRLRRGVCKLLEDSPYRINDSMGEIIMSWDPRIDPEDCEKPF